MRKRLLRTFTAAVLVCSVLSVQAFAESATVSASDVNMRSGPGMGYDVIDCLPLGTAVTVTDRSNDTWYAVSFNGQNGYMSSRYLTLEEQAAPEITQSQEGSGYVNAMYVNFRSGPDSSSSIIGQFNKGKALTINGSSGQWTYVTVDGESGYIFSTYVSSGTAPAQVYVSRPVYETEGGATYEFENDEPVIIEIPAEQTPAATPTPAAADTAASAATPTPAPAPQPTPTPVVLDTSNGFPGRITGDYVRFRTGPSTGYTIIESYNKGKELSSLGQEGDWVKAVIDGTVGYVYAQYVYIEEPDFDQLLGSLLGGSGSSAPASAPTPTPTPAPAPTPTPELVPTPAPVEASAGYVSGNDVRFRSGPSMSSQIIGTFYYGNSVTITGYSGDWTAVDYNGQSGYVYSQYVQSGTFSVGGSEPEVTESGAVTGRQIADFALQFVGYNYCWGGSSPDTGFDCSGLVYYTYQHFGYTLNRVAADQARNGVSVSHDDLQPGDILCFYSSGSYIGHSAIYIGDGMFVHSSTATTGVIITPLDSYYSTRGYEARRILG